MAELESAGAGDDLASPQRESQRPQMSPATSATAEELRRQVADRLAEHRRRRGGGKAQAAEPQRSPVGGRSARIAAAVAERYARTPSYREMLAAEAERTIQQARAAAEVAAQNAQAIAAAQQRLLDAYDAHAIREQAERSGLPACDQPAATLDGAETQGFASGREESAGNPATEQQLWPELVAAEQGTKWTEPARSAKAARRGGARRANDAAHVTASADAGAGLTVRLYEDAAHGSLLSARLVGSAGRDRGRGERGFSGDVYAAEAMALDDEIAFRQAPVFEEPAGPPMVLPANLIEFPRQLVAARKARPRHAEGPLRDEMEAAPGDGQLRIFEVDPAQISSSPADAEAQAAQWTSLWLDAPAQRERGKDEADALIDAPFALAVPVLQPASLRRRVAAGAINLTVAGCGLMAFAAVAVAIAGHPDAVRLAQAGLQWRTMVTIGAVSGAFLMMLYHGLFFWFSTATPGMRCVRVALCTFEDGNPTRRRVRRRMAATMLSACSMGMGYAWAALDEEGLTWHDRMSRMYLRRY